MKYIISLLFIGIFTFNFAQSFEKVDSLMNIRQPNAAYDELLSIFKTAQKEEDVLSLIRAYPYFKLLMDAKDMQERKDLFFHLLAMTEDFPEPAKSINKSFLINELKNYYPWFNYKSEALFDTLNLSDSHVRFEFALREMEQLEGNLEGLNKFPIADYEEALKLTKDSKILINTVADYLAYQLIDLYQSSLIRNGGGLKKSPENIEEWYALTISFQNLNLGDNLTERILRLYQLLEKNHYADALLLSRSVYNRLHFLQSFSNEEIPEKTWEYHYHYFQESEARSKFIYEMEKRRYLKGKEYHFEKNPKAENLIKQAFDRLKEELEIYPENDFAIEMKEVLSAIQEKERSINFPKQVTTNQQIPFKIDYRNTAKQYLYLYKIDLPLLDLKEDLRSFLRSGKAELVREIPLQLIDKGLFQSRATELFLDGISTPGNYYIVASNKKVQLEELAQKEMLDWSNANLLYSSLLVSAISATYIVENNQLRVLVMDAQKEKIIPNAKIQIYKSIYNKTISSTERVLIEEGKTNKDGIFTFPFDESLSPEVLVQVKNSSFKFHPRLYKTTPPKETLHIELFTDRAIYRPGQTIYFKGIAYQGKENEFQVAPQKEVHFTLLDASFQQIYEASFQTNTYGSFDGSYQLPMDLPLGNFRLSARIEGEEAYKSVSVEEYKRPTFEVTLNQPETTSKLNERVELSGNAQAFAGYGIAGAQVVYTVYRNWSSFWYFYFPGSSGGDLLKTDTLFTDNEGNFVIDFIAETDPNAEKMAYYYYEVSARITDISGETHEEKLHLTFNKLGLSLQTELPEKWFNHLEQDFKVALVNLYGKEQKDLKGEIEIYKKIQPERFLPRIWGNVEDSRMAQAAFEKEFPYQGWIANPEETLELVQKRNFISGERLSLKDVLGQEEGEYLLKFHYYSPSGDTISLTKSVLAIAVNSKKSIAASPLWGFVSSNERKVGEKVNYQLASSFKDAKALVTISRKGEIISQKWVKLKDRTSICYEITEEDRGGVVFDAVLFQGGNYYTSSHKVNVPFDNKRLKIKTSVFRDLLEPGQKETWSFTIEDDKGQFKNAELAAAMYDASLDQFRSNSWSLFPYRSNISNRYWVKQNFGIGSFSDFRYNYLNSLSLDYWKYQSSGMFYIYGISIRGARGERDYLMSAMPAVAKRGDSDAEAVVEDSAEFDSKEEQEQMPDKNREENTPRSNFEETAFFYPLIYQNEKEEYELNFTLPDVLTKWKLLLFAHNKEMQVDAYETEIIAQKELMITANTPRFVRRGDTLVFSGKLVNLTEENQNIRVELALNQPLKEVSLNQFIIGEAVQEMEVKAYSSQQVKWMLVVEAEDLMEYTLTAQNETYSDGERNLIPILSNRVLINENEHIIIREKGEKAYQFDAFVNQHSPTLENKQLVIDYTDNLAWNAVKALPYLAKREDQSLIALMNSYYANAVSAHILQAYPKIKMIFNQWKTATPDAFLSELEKREEVKNILLKETPWVVDAQNEAEQRRRIAVLFELNQLQDNQQALLRVLESAQNGDGGFSWFKEGKSNSYITQQIVMRIGQLKQLGIEVNELEELTSKAMQYLSLEQLANYKQWKARNEKGNSKYSMGAMDSHWLYVRSLLEAKEDKDLEELIAFYQAELQEKWKVWNPYEQSIAGIYLKREGNDKEAQFIFASLKDRAKKNTNLGMYWVENSGYFWNENKISTQAQIIQFFKEMNADESLLDDARFWLILNKETHAWSSNIQTADAIAAILLSHTDYLKTSPAPKVHLGEKTLVYTTPSNSNEIQVEYTEGIGQLSHTWTGNEIQSDLGIIRVEKLSEGPAALNIYWQYTEELEKVKSSNNASLHIQKKYKKLVPGEKKVKGEETTRFSVGDQIEVELIITVDRDLEFVYIKDLRPSGFEPVDAISGYRWDAGMTYYLSPKDASMDFFVERLEKGSYQLNYTVYATHEGVYNSGLSSIQCLYAPGFAAHSESMRIEVK